MQLRGNRGLMVAGTKNIESYYPNSIATYVNGQLWQKLLDRFVYECSTSAYVLLVNAVDKVSKKYSKVKFHKSLFS